MRGEHDCYRRGIQLTISDHHQDVINAIAGASDAVYASLKTRARREHKLWTRRQPPPDLARLRLVSLLVCST